MREIITLQCNDCKNRNYTTTKNRKQHPDRLETQKFCNTCRKHTGTRKLSEFVSLDEFTLRPELDRRVAGCKWNRTREWFCYMLQCSDGSFYVGAAKDPVARTKRHNLGVARDIPHAAPGEMVWHEEYASELLARGREAS